MTDPALQALLDKQAIAELLTRYLRSVDRGDVATLRACYLPGGATEDHGGLFDRPRTTWTALPPRLPIPAPGPATT